MKSVKSGAGRLLPSRRAFLRGAAGATVALPFLESMPERSPWAADGDKPVFGFFICAVGGVVRSSFFPDATGPLTAAGLAAAGKATSQLASHADNLLFLSGVNWAANSMSDSHIEGLCISLTAKAPFRDQSSSFALGASASADTYIAARVHRGKDPLALYAGNTQSFGGQRLSWAQAGQLTPVMTNPYTLYLQLMGLAGPDGGMTADDRRTAQLLLASRKSVHDLVRDELTTLMQHPRLSAADRQRLQLHFDAIRDAEKTMTGMAGDALDACSSLGLDVTTLEALSTYKYDAHRTDEIVRLHMSLVAMAFACNFRRAASLQWGDPYDRTVYDVPSNADRKWIFAFISHRLMSDGASGSDFGDPLAAQAHAEIDVVRMKTLAAGLDHFRARGLADQCFVMWTNHYAEGPSHSFRNIPHIIWGNAGGALKQGQYLDANGTTNSPLLTTLINAAVKDTHTTVTDFGDGTGAMLDIIRA